MGRELKIAVIGAGSSYTPELIEGFVEARSELNVVRIAMMDIDEHKLAIVGGLAGRMLEAAGVDVELELTTERPRAIEGAHYVINQIRVGQMAARIQDEKIPLRFGVIGQETTGPGGFAKALRTIPVALEIARDMRQLAPGAFLLNFTNPAGLITEALVRYGEVPVIGLCNLPIGIEMRLAQALGVDRKRIAIDHVGLNHLNWLRGVWIDGQDIWEQVFQQAMEEARQRPEDDEGFSAELLETLECIPCDYLNYYYNHDRMLAKQLKAEKTRGEEVMEIERQLMEMYQDPNLREKPKLLEKRGGAYYSKVAVSLISAIENNKNEVHVVNTLNRGAIPNLPPDVVVEVPCVIGAGGARPLVTAPMPPQIAGLTQQVKAYEVLAAKAGAEGDRRAALQALLAHPLVPSFSAAKGLLDALLEAHRPFLPQFFRQG
ncbi:MAG: 6-phospho-beta-glucosidase [Anaerolineae bacterium]|nr:6-phospho-beta-glucosidase [Anaerolineae bacterium]MDW8100798.1 6-phospho-beta-glucosidase [Anaerolineae bacterium]